MGVLSRHLAEIGSFNFFDDSDANEYHGANIHPGHHGLKPHTTSFGFKITNSMGSDLLTSKGSTKMQPSQEQICKRVRASCDRQLKTGSKPCSPPEPPSKEKSFGIGTLKGLDKGLGRLPGNDCGAQMFDVPMEGKVYNETAKKYAVTGAESALKTNSMKEMMKIDEDTPAFMRSSVWGTYNQPWANSWAMHSGTPRIYDYLYKIQQWDNMASPDYYLCDHNSHPHVCALLGGHLRECALNYSADTCDQFEDHGDYLDVKVLGWSKKYSSWTEVDKYPAVCKDGKDENCPSSAIAQGGDIIAESTAKPGYFDYLRDQTMRNQNYWPWHVPQEQITIRVPKSIFRHGDVPDLPPYLIKSKKFGNRPGLERFLVSGIMDSLAPLFGAKVHTHAANLAMGVKRNWKPAPSAWMEKMKTAVSWGAIIAGIGIFKNLVMTSIPVFGSIVDAGLDFFFSEKEYIPVAFDLNKKCISNKFGSQFCYPEARFNDIIEGEYYLSPQWESRFNDTLNQRRFALALLEYSKKYDIPLSAQASKFATVANIDLKNVLITMKCGLSNINAPAVWASKTMNIDCRGGKWIMSPKLAEGFLKDHPSLIGNPKMQIGVAKGNTYAGDALWTFPAARNKSFFLPKLPISKIRKPHLSEDNLKLCHSKHESESCLKSGCNWIRPMDTRFQNARCSAIKSGKLPTMECEKAGCTMTENGCRFRGECLSCEEAITPTKVGRIAESEAAINTTCDSARKLSLPRWTDKDWPLEKPESFGSSVRKFFGFSDTPEDRSTSGPRAEGLQDTTNEQVKKITQMQKTQKEAQADLAAAKEDLQELQESHQEENFSQAEYMKKRDKINQETAQAQRTLQMTEDFLGKAYPTEGTVQLPSTENKMQKNRGNAPNASAGEIMEQ